MKYSHFVERIIDETGFDEQIIRKILEAVPLILRELEGPDDSVTTPFGTVSLKEVKGKRFWGGDGRCRMMGDRYRYVLSEPHSFKTESYFMKYDPLTRYWYRLDALHNRWVERMTEKLAEIRENRRKPPSNNQS